MASDDDVELSAFLSLCFSVALYMICLSTSFVFMHLVHKVVEYFF